MPQAKSKTKVGLGNSLMNDRFGRGGRTSQHKASHGITRVAQDGTEYKINDKEEAAWVKMRSVTEQGDLDEFLANAELAGTDFTAEKITGTKILHVDQKNPYLLSANEERAVTRKHNENKGALTVPRRPPWDENTTPHKLDEMERESLLNWRRGLADLQENKDLLMTPFERNIEVWRQLWRVAERSDLVVQIVDARNPLLYRSEDLERYVKEIDDRKENLLLVNKADMLTLEQRASWAAFFEKNKIKYKYFSARLARESIEGSDEEEREESVEDLIRSRRETATSDNITGETRKLQINEEEDANSEEETDTETDDDNGGEEDWSDEEEDFPKESHRTRILSVDELERLFQENAPDISDDGEGLEQEQRKTTVGLVGYPNVGKSSTINALVGAKKVSVSSTPGKTKHFQTIHLSDKVILCDCPGLVFPNFAITKAELVVNGVLPIDQQREFTGPVGLVAQRIPRSFFESLYGVKIHTRPTDEGGTGVPTADELLTAYAKIRGFSAQNKSGWDTSRAARVVLKDYVNGKLLWCTPPPREPPCDEKNFNRRLYDRAHLPLKRQIQLAAEDLRTQDSSSSNATNQVDTKSVSLMGGSKSDRLDRNFFGSGRGNAGHLSRPFNYKYTEQGKHLSGRKAKTMTALEKGVDQDEVITNGKKHFKGKRRVKQRNKETSTGYD